MYPESGSGGASAAKVSGAEQFLQKFEPSRFSAKHLGHCIVSYSHRL